MKTSYLNNAPYQPVDENEGDFQIVVNLYLSDQLPVGFIRVSIGVREENDVFINKLTNILESQLYKDKR